MAFILCMCNDEEKDLTQRKYMGEMFSYQYTPLKLTCLSCNDENVQTWSPMVFLACVYQASMTLTGLFRDANLNEHISNCIGNERIELF